MQLRMIRSVDVQDYITIIVVVPHPSYYSGTHGYCSSLLCAVESSNMGVQPVFAVRDLRVPYVAVI